MKYLDNLALEYSCLDYLSTESGISLEEELRMKNIRRYFIALAEAQYLSKQIDTISERINAFNKIYFDLSFFGKNSL